MEDIVDSAPKTGSDGSGDTQEASAEDEKLSNSSLPRYDCQEKIVICLDLDEEMNSKLFTSRAGDKYTSLEMAKRAIKMFVMHKHSINPKHEFALITFQDTAVVREPLTAQPSPILQWLDDLTADLVAGPLDMANLFDTVLTVACPPSPATSALWPLSPPPWLVRLLLLYGRSHCPPSMPQERSQVQEKLESSPYFFTDVLYIHEVPSEDNKCEEIFSALCQLDHRGQAYILDACKTTHVLNASAKLLAHPLQRPPQAQARYTLHTNHTAHTAHATHATHAAHTAHTAHTALETQLHFDNTQHIQAPAHSVMDTQPHLPAGQIHTLPDSEDEL